MVGGSNRGELLGTLESKGEREVGEEEDGSSSLSFKKYLSKSSSLRVVKSGPRQESRKGTSLMRRGNERRKEQMNNNNARTRVKENTTSYKSELGPWPCLFNSSYPFSSGFTRRGADLFQHLLFLIF